MNAIDEVQNIKPFVPLDLFIHFYFNTILKANTSDSIINDVLPSVTCTAILSLITRKINSQTKLFAHIPVLKVTRSNLDSGTHFNLSYFQFVNSKQPSFLQNLLFIQTTNHENIIIFLRFGTSKMH